MLVPEERAAPWARGQPRCCVPPSPMASRQALEPLGTASIHVCCRRHVHQGCAPWGLTPQTCGGVGGPRVSLCGGLWLCRVALTPCPWSLCFWLAVCTCSHLSKDL